jgi:hypothetical protein
MTATLDRTKPKLDPADLPLIVLKNGGHGSRNNGLCAMEAVSWLAGEEHSDHPECVCPVIGAFMRQWNDDLPTDEDRNRLLLPLLPKILDTASTPEVRLARVMLIIDWFCREHLPAWLELSPALAGRAAELRAASPIQQWSDFDTITPIITATASEAAAAWAAARDAARDAAWDAARAAARAAARDAARDAARAAARDAARAAARDAAWAAAWDAARAAAWDAARAAAWDAAWDAARAAARAAAWDAARDAAREKLKPTVSKLQESAVALVERMASLK